MKAIIFGAGGQDGYYLTERLLDCGYQVFGVVRRSSIGNTQRLDRFKSNKNFKLLEGDITDYTSVQSIIKQYKPQEVYNLAGQSSVGISFKQPIYTFNSICNGCLNILEAIKGIDTKIKFYQASSGEMYGNSFSSRRPRTGKIIKYQDENTIMSPQSPYAVAKLAAHNLVGMYRKTYDMFACSGILYNHDSPMRSEDFVTRKISKWVADFSHWVDENKCFAPNCLLRIGEDCIYAGDQSFPKLRLGNIKVVRDWGHARDYVEAMHLMMLYRMPDDYIISTGKVHSVEDFLYEAFGCVGIINPLDYIVIDPSLYRPSEVYSLSGDSSKAKFILNWRPKYDFTSIVHEMVLEDIHNAKKRAGQSTQSGSVA